MSVRPNRLGVTVAIALLAACLLMGCHWFPKTTSGSDSDTPNEVILSPEQVADQILPKFQPIYDRISKLERSTALPDEFRAEMMQIADDAMAEHKGHPEAARAFRRVSYQLFNYLAPARQAQNGEMVLLLVDLVKKFNPQNELLGSYIEWAHKEKSRPVVKLRGWYEDMVAEEETVYAFLEVTLPGKDEVHDVRARPGQTFYDVQFLEILGNKAGLRLKYLVTGDLYDVYGRVWQLQQDQLPASWEDAS